MKSTYKTVEQDLAQFAIDAHGGLERWKRFSTVSVHGIIGGVLWGAKGKAGVLSDVRSQSTRGTRRFRTGRSALGIEGLASNHNGSPTRTQTAT